MGLGNKDAREVRGYRASTQGGRGAREQAHKEGDGLKSKSQRNGDKGVEYNLARVNGGPVSALFRQFNLALSWVRE